MTEERRDPVAEQEEAARKFEERTGRKSTDPAVGWLQQDSSGRVITAGSTPRDPDSEVDHFARHGIERTHVHMPELASHDPGQLDPGPVDEDGRPTAVFLRAPGGTNPILAISAAVEAMFGAPEKRPEAIEEDAHEGAIDVDSTEAE